MAKDEGLIKDRYEIIFKELQNILAFGYLALIIIGMIYEAIYYSYFAINIFEYSEVLDFLLAPFRRPLTIIYLLIAITAMVVGFILDKWFQKMPKLYRFLHFGMANKSWFPTYRRWSLVITFILLVVIYAGLVGKISYEKILDDKKPDLEIQFSETDHKFTGKSIGKNGSYLFLLDMDHQVYIIPIDNDIRLIRPLQSD